MKKLIFLVSIFILGLGIFSCSENPTVVEDNSYSLTIVNDGTVTENVDMGNLIDATVEADMTYSSPCQNMMMTPTPAAMQLPLVGILKQLNLTADQITEIRAYAKDYFDCISRAQKVLRATEEAIVKRANVARREVFAKLKAGEITREQAARQIATINKAAREAMQNSEARKAALAQIKDCLKDYIAKIRLILNDRQLLKFNELLQKLRADLTIG
jgi:hypothetical protein